MRQTVGLWVFLVLVSCATFISGAGGGTAVGGGGSIAASVNENAPGAGSTRFETGTFTDPRDGEVYKWVQIGTQIWMAENLRFKTQTGSWCWKNDEVECKTRGRFYDWETAQRIAPPGWHLASEKEWQTLEAFLGLTPEQIEQTGIERGGDTNTIASRLKLPGSWPTEYEGNQLEITNDTAFSAVKTGFYARGEFTHAGSAGWWTSTEEKDKAWVRHIEFFDNKCRRNINDKSFAFSVRCVKDASPKN